MSKHFDVVVLGGGVAALTTAALLARRAFRVLVVGQGHRPARYGYDGLPLSRRAFAFNSAGTAVAKKVFAELALTQTLQRRLRDVEPAAQLLAPDLRLDLFAHGSTASATELRASAFARALPSARRAAIDELAAAFARVDAAADAAFGADAVWPPEGFWERRSVRALLQALPHRVAEATSGGATNVAAFAADLGATDPLRQAVLLPAAFASSAAGTPWSFAVARLAASYARGRAVLAEGEGELHELLAERVRAHGGEVRPHESAARVVTRGRHISGVELGGGEPVGCQFVVSEGSREGLASLMPEDALSTRARTALRSPRGVAGRFVMSTLVRREGLPEPLGREAFVLPTWPPRSDDVSGLHLSVEPAGDLTLLVAETWLPAGASTAKLREQLLEQIEAVLPFVSRHVVLVDSPHDGRPLWDFRGEKPATVERALLRRGGGSAEPEPMAPRYDLHGVDVADLEGLAGEPVRLPVRGAFVVGPTVLPALGQEGELVSAWSVARVITRTDRQKEKMRREMWSKVELR